MTSPKEERDTDVGERSPSRETQLSTHILSVSAALVGVCITVIGLLRIGVESGSLKTIADNLLAIDAMTFLGASIAAYLALRAGSTAQARRRERTADVLFLAALAVMVVVAGLVAFEVI